MRARSCYRCQGGNEWGTHMRWIGKVLTEPWPQPKEDVWLARFLLVYGIPVVLVLVSAASGSLGFAVAAGIALSCTETSSQPLS